MAENEWKTLEVLPDACGQIRYVLYHNEKLGLFAYSIERHICPTDEYDQLMWPNGHWRMIARSGLYGLATEALKDAQEALEAWRQRTER